ncbi:ORF6N domain-containing protein [Serratia sp. L9]|uniref:ORF6N domain-containing protein n=1 Tax=Serratia sp. L9 TaxID=3423946 RepID=UPI003D66B891
MAIQITAETLSPVTYNSIAVITTELLAQLYSADVKHIQNNFLRNTDRFTAGKHYFKLEGVKLKEFKNRPSLRGSVAKHTRSLILWTERGAARHAKMLETDQAWEVFEKLEDHYFNQSKASQPPAPEIKMHTIELTDEELCNLCWLWSAAEYMREQIAAAHPALELLRSQLAPSFYSMGFEYIRTLDRAKQTLARETQTIKPHAHKIEDANWRSVLPRLRDVELTRVACIGV